MQARPPLIRDLLGNALGQQPHGRLRATKPDGLVDLLTVLLLQPRHEVIALPSRIPNGRSSTEARQPKDTLGAQLAELVEMEKAEVGKAQRPSRPVGLLQAHGLVMGPSMCADQPIDVAGQEIKAEADVQGGTCAVGGTATTVGPDRSKGIREGNSGGVLDQHGGEAVQKRNRYGISGNELGRSGVEHLLQAGGSALREALIKPLWSNADAACGSDLRQGFEGGVGIG